MHAPISVLLGSLPTALVYVVLLIVAYQWILVKDIERSFGLWLFVWLWYIALLSWISLVKDCWSWVFLRIRLARLSAASLTTSSCLSEDSMNCLTCDCFPPYAMTLVAWCALPQMTDFIQVLKSKGWFFDVGFYCRYPLLSWWASLFLCLASTTLIALVATENQEKRAIVRVVFGSAAGVLGMHVVTLAIMWYSRMSGEELQFAWWSDGWMFLHGHGFCYVPHLTREEERETACCCCVSSLSSVHFGPNKEWLDVVMTRVSNRQQQDASLRVRLPPVGERRLLVSSQLPGFIQRLRTETIQVEQLL